MSAAMKSNSLQQGSGSGSKSSAHAFHIPVMGTGFTLDTPLKVAKYGISSVISLVDDRLIEQVRKYHCEAHNLPYTEIGDDREDFRADRITAYLNLLKEIVDTQVESLKASEFVAESEITRYFSLLPEGELKDSYRSMLAESDPKAKEKLADKLRQSVSVGSIDVNIMTKLDRDRYVKGVKQSSIYADALSALRGFAQSKVESSIIFSAGLNRRLFSYLTEFKDFLPDVDGMLKKKIVLKVSDYRSACIQSKFLAKKGLWTSEFRVESGLNCGGHAFATPGHLMGTILKEFQAHRSQLTVELRETYLRALSRRGIAEPKEPQEFKLTVQGGIGTFDESNFLRQQYGVDGTGWGTPFLLVPEVTNLDPEHIKKLCLATEQDVELSNVSPLGIPFWSLKNSASEIVRQERVKSGRPGSPCPKGHLVSDTEFTDTPICRASRTYQRRKLNQIDANLPKDKQAEASSSVIRKACICHDLAGGLERNYHLNPKASPSVCCGPNIVNFSDISTLEEMVGHIYGRLSRLTNPNRSHMFITELSLNVDHLGREIKKASQEMVDKTSQNFYVFKSNLIDGIEHYRKLAEKMTETQREVFESQLKALLERIEVLLPEPQTSFA